MTLERGSVGPKVNYPLRHNQHVTVPCFTILMPVFFVFCFIRLTIEKIKAEGEADSMKS